MTAPGEPGTGQRRSGPPGGAKSPPPGTRQRKGDAPRRVRTGIKLRARDGVIPSAPLADRWVSLLKRLVPPAVLEEGLRYARMGQTISLQCEGGALIASVQGRRVQPYQTVVTMGVFDAAQWERIIDAMTGEAVYLVKLLDGALPEGMDNLLSAMGLSLLSDDASGLSVECQCGAPAPCKHAAAIGCLFAEQLAGDPLRIFALRGMPAERLLERLRHARAIRARGMAAAHADPMIPETLREAPSLESCAEEFWRPPSSGAQHLPPPPQHVPHALLRRLGPSPLQGRFPLVGLLASIYDAVAEHAVKLRDRAERVDDGRAGEDASRS